MRIVGMRILAASCGFLFAAAAAIAQQDPAPKAESLRGRVVDANGKPIAGAAVGLFNHSDFVDTALFLAKPPAVTGEDGTYALPLGSAASRRRLVIAAAGHQGLATWLHDGQEPADAVGDVVLPPGARLVGRVRDQHGAPLAGVRLRVESSIPQQVSGRQPPQLLACARSNNKGIFTVPCVPRTGLRLFAEADGYLAESLLVAQESPIDLVLVTVGVVRGKVVDRDGLPVAGARVYGVTSETNDARISVTSAADGTFVLAVPTRGRFRIAAFMDQPPHRESSSGLLHGPADDVCVKPIGDGEAAAATLEVQVVDAATKQPLPKFAVSFLSTEPGNLQAALFHGRQGRTEYEGKAILDLSANRQAGLYIEAADHGFEVVPMPEDKQTPLVVALGPEAVLRGRVLDAATGKPMAGVAVRALPKGNTSGSGGSAKDAGPLSDEHGVYVVRGLRPGDYGVQAHAEGRAASPVEAVTLAAGGEAKLDLTVPKARFVDVEITGALPRGPVPRLQFGGGVTTHGHQPGFFQHTLAEPAPLPLPGPGRFRMGPLTLGTRALQVFVPSRTRIGFGIAVALGDIDSENATATIALPDLATVLVKGRIELSSEVPTARVAVLATRRSDAADNRNWWSRTVGATGIDGGGRFELDLPMGTYLLQLADLATGIVFHTEAEDTIVGDQQLVLKPELHWLTVACEPATAGGEVIVQHFQVTLEQPRDGSAFLQSWGDINGQQTGGVAGRALVAAPKWLLPRGTIAIRAMQSFDMLRPTSNGASSNSVAEATLDIDQAEHRVVLTIPAPPSDEAVLQRR